MRLLLTLAWLLTASAQQKQITPANGPLQFRTPNGEGPLDTFMACAPGTGDPAYDGRVFLIKNAGKIPLVIARLRLAAGADPTVWRVHAGELDYVLYPSKEMWVSVGFTPPAVGSSDTKLQWTAKNGGRLIGYEVPLVGRANDCANSDEATIEEVGEGVKDDGIDEDDVPESEPEPPKEEPPKEEPPKEEPPKEEPPKEEPPKEEPPKEEPPKEEPPKEEPPKEEPSLGLTGALAGPCPDGVRTLALILQFDDKSGFDYLARKFHDVYRLKGSQNAKHSVDVVILRAGVVGDMRKKGSRAPRLDVLQQKIQQLLKSLVQRLRAAAA